MASVHLNFLQPQIPDLVKLTIFEAPAADGLFSPIEEITNIGVYPDYISEYTTDDATSATDWFAIQWTDSKGATTDMSAPRQGGVDVLPAIIVERVLLRDPTIKEGIALQEAEAVIQWYYKGADPYAIDPADVTYTILSGLTLLTMARCYVSAMASASQADSWTAGLVSMKSDTSTGSAQRNWQDLLSLANTLLGISMSVVAQMKAIEIAGGKQIASADLSRLIVEWQ
jgi:hypothetical protein